MGHFSWCYCDAGKIERDVEGHKRPKRRQRLMAYSDLHPASVLFPAEFGGKKAQIDIDMYLDYGIFGREDIYNLVADWNREWIASHPAYIVPSEKEDVVRYIGMRERWRRNHPGCTIEEAERALKEDMPRCHFVPRKMCDMPWWPFYSDLSLSRKEVAAKWNEIADSKCAEYREIGIYIAGRDEDNAALPYPIKIAKNRDSVYEKCLPSLSDPYQGGW